MPWLLQWEEELGKLDELLALLTSLACSRSVTIRSRSNSAIAPLIVDMGSQRPVCVPLGDWEIECSAIQNGVPPG